MGHSSSHPSTPMSSGSLFSDISTEVLTTAKEKALAGRGSGKPGTSQIPPARSASHPGCVLPGLHDPPGDASRLGQVPALPVAWPAEYLQVFNIVAAAVAVGHNVVYLEIRDGPTRNATEITSLHHGQHHAIGDGPPFPLTKARNLAPAATKRSHLVAAAARAADPPQQERPPAALRTVIAFP